MKSARHLVGRSLTWLVVGVAVFTGVLATLPVPEAAEGPARGVPEETFAIVDVTAFDGEAFRQGWDVWIEDGRIRHAGQRLDLPEDLPRVDGRGHTLIPGLIDGHVHSFLSTLGDALRFGVTTVLDQSTDPAFAAAMRPAREEVARGTQADLFSAGMTATAPEGHGTQFGIPVETLTGPDEAAEWVRARKAEGSDWIKIIYEDGSAFDMEIASLDGETVAAVIAAAHAEGLAAVVHVSTLETALEAMAFGADGLVHVWRDEVVSEADARRFAEADIFVVPTLSVMVSADDPAVAELVRETDDAMLSPIQRQTLDGRFPGGLAEGGDVAMENVRRLRAAGVRLVAGTDSPEPGNRGGNLHARGAAPARARRHGERGGAGGGDFGGGGRVRRRGARPDRRRPSRRPGAGARRPRGRRVAQPRHRRDLEGRVSGGSCGRLRRGRASGRDRARPCGNPGRGLRGRVRGELRRMGRDDGPD